MAELTTPLQALSLHEGNRPGDKQTAKQSAKQSAAAKMAAFSATTGSKSDAASRVLAGAKRIPMSPHSQKLRAKKDRLADSVKVAMLPVPLLLRATGSLPISTSGDLSAAVNLATCIWPVRKRPSLSSP